SGRAEAALQAVLCPEPFLQWVQLAVLDQALDCQDFTAIRLYGEHGAGFDGFAVEEHGAGAAMAGVAPDVAASQLQYLANKVDQQKPRLDFGLSVTAIDLDTNQLLVRHCQLLG